MPSYNRAGKGRTEDLTIANLVLDARLQCRADGLNQDHLEIVTDAIKANAPVPRILVFRIKDMGDLPVEGFHRIESRKRLGKKTIPAYVRNGTWEEAVLAAAGANKEHNSLIRTRPDKTNAARLVLQHYPKWTDSRIAKEIGVSNHLVADVRAELEEAGRLKPEPVRESISGKKVQAKIPEPSENGQAKPRRPAKAKPEGAPDQGSLVHDWERGDRAFSEMVRCLDSMVKTFPDELKTIFLRGKSFTINTGTPIADAINDALNFVRHEWEQTHKAILAAKS
jgi:hypothetical protein